MRSVHLEGSGQWSMVGKNKGLATALILLNTDHRALITER
jgi:hypothetical protein